MLLIQRFEEISARAEEAFCVPHHEEAGRIQGVVKDGEHSLLQRRAQINENVAATDQVHPGKWRVNKNNLRRTDTHSPDRFCDLISTFRLTLKTFKPYGS